MNARPVVLAVLPELLNVNGDAENALVLARRAEWAGHSAEVVRLAAGEAAPRVAPGAVVIGSAPDDSLDAGLSGLLALRPALEDWIAAGVPVLAVGTGWELIGESIALRGGTIEGLGLLPSRAVAAESRVADDLVVVSPFGRLIGFENHARDTELLVDTDALGAVRYGRGNGAGAALEGLQLGSVIATHLHGPVFAKNPSLADSVLASMLGDDYVARSSEALRVDEMARAARNQIAVRLGLEAE